MKNKKGIILAADIEGKQDLLKTISRVSPYIEAIKIGNEVLYNYGWNIITEIKKTTQCAIIADLKLMDIPEIARRLTLAAIKAGADGIMICGITGEDTICECRMFSENKMLFVFTQFTHNTGLISNEMADNYINLALEYKCDGIQIPGTKPERIREVRKRIGSNLMIISCGVGTQGPSYGSAIAAGADYEIIGRSIYTSENPEEEAQKAYDQIKEIINE